MIRKMPYFIKLVMFTKPTLTIYNTDFVKVVKLMKVGVLMIIYMDIKFSLSW